MSLTGRIILVSNRGPVQYEREGGERTTSRGDALLDRADLAVDGPEGALEFLKRLGQ